MLKHKDLLGPILIIFSSLAYADQPLYNCNDLQYGISLNLKENFSGEDLLNKIKKAVQKFNFEPDVVLVCAGFDGLSNEGFSGGLIPQNYYEIGAYLASLSKQMISFLEGGYQEDLAQSTVYYCLGTGGLLPKNLPSRVNNATLEQISQMLEGVYDQVRGNGVRLNI